MCMSTYGYIGRDAKREQKPSSSYYRFDIVCANRECSRFNTETLSTCPASKTSPHSRKPSQKGSDPQLAGPNSGRIYYPCQYEVTKVVREFVVVRRGKQ